MPPEHSPTTHTAIHLTLHYHVSHAPNADAIQHTFGWHHDGIGTSVAEFETPGMSPSEIDRLRRELAHRAGEELLKLLRAAPE